MTTTPLPPDVTPEVKAPKTPLRKNGRRVTVVLDPFDWALLERASFGAGKKMALVIRDLIRTLA